MYEKMRAGWMDGWMGTLGGRCVDGRNQREKREGGIRIMVLYSVNVHT